MTSIVFKSNFIVIVLCVGMVSIRYSSQAKDNLQNGYPSQSEVPQGYPLPYGYQEGYTQQSTFPSTYPPPLPSGQLLPYSDPYGTNPSMLSTQGNSYTYPNNQPSQNYPPPTSYPPPASYPPSAPPYPPSGTYPPPQTYPPAYPFIQQGPSDNPYMAAASSYQPYPTPGVQYQTQQLSPYQSNTSYPNQSQQLYPNPGTSYPYTPPSISPQSTYQGPYGNGQQTYGYVSRSVDPSSQPNEASSSPHGNGQQTYGYVSRSVDPSSQSDQASSSPHGNGQQTYGYVSRSVDPSSQSDQASSSPHGNGQHGDDSQCVDSPTQQSPLEASTATVRPFSSFDARRDAETLNSAIPESKTCEADIIHVLAHRTNNQRQEIASAYQTMFSRPLLPDFTVGLHHHRRFKDLIVGLMAPTYEFLATEIQYAINVSDEKTLIDIICTATAFEINKIKMAYQRKFNNSLETQISQDDSGNFYYLLVTLIQVQRNENEFPDDASVTADAKTLSKADTDERTFIMILCSRSFKHLQQVFTEYNRLTSTDIKDAVSNRFTGSIDSGLSAIVISVRDQKPYYFAKRLYESMVASDPVNDRLLIRIVATRCEIDMVEIKNAYGSLYPNRLACDIKKYTLRDLHYKICLEALVEG